MVKKEKILKELLELSPEERIQIISFFDHKRKPSRKAASKQHLQPDYWLNVVANLPALQLFKRQLASQTATKQD